MNKTALGTILGSALLGLIKAKSGNKAKKVNITISTVSEIEKNFPKQFQEIFQKARKICDSVGIWHNSRELWDSGPFKEGMIAIAHQGVNPIGVLYGGAGITENSGDFSFDVCVLEEYQHQGIGEKLVDFAIEYAKNIDKYIYIQVSENSIDFFLKKGFTVDVWNKDVIYLGYDPQKGSANKPNRKKKFIVRSVEQGLKVIEHKDITDNWKKSLKVRPKHRVAVLLPCAATKPFAESPSHKYGYLKALGDKDVDLYVVSEPLGIIPYAWQDKYPNADYDYPPKYLKGKARKLLSERIGEWFKKVYPKYDTVYSALPGHHQRLVNDSTDQKLKEVTINQCRQDTCSDSVFRATAGEYVNYLKREIK